MVEPDNFQEKRKIRTGLSGWRYNSFCKTQYASSPSLGGVSNFVRAHLCVIHLLDRMKKIVKVEYDDEGNYGRSYYTDDPSAKERVYTWHPGKYNVKALIEEVGEWNEMIAAAFGGLKDLGVESPIRHFSNFEQLEFRGQKQKNLKEILEAIKTLGQKPEEDKKRKKPSPGGAGT